MKYTIPTLTRSFAAGLACTALISGAALSLRADGKKNDAKKSAPSKTKAADTKWDDRVVKSEAEWKKTLTPEQFEIMRKAGTEPAFHNKYFDFHGKGMFVCAACGNPLFDTKTKFDSGTGWPSFWQAISKKAVVNKTDRTIGMERTEVLCRRCDSHLGHVFDDGPAPTHLRYCMNSAALKFVGK